MQSRIDKNTTNSVAGIQFDFKRFQSKVWFSFDTRSFEFIIIC